MVENPGTDALHDAMNYSTLPRCIPTFEYNNNLRSTVSYPFLHFDKPSLQFTKLALVLLFLRFSFLPLAPPYEHRTQQFRCIVCGSAHRHVNWQFYQFTCLWAEPQTM